VPLPDVVDPLPMVPEPEPEPEAPGEVPAVLPDVDAPVVGRPDVVPLELVELVAVAPVAPVVAVAPVAEAEWPAPVVAPTPGAAAAAGAVGTPVWQARVCEAWALRGPPARRRAASAAPVPATAAAAACVMNDRMMKVLLFEYSVEYEARPWRPRAARSSGYPGGENLGSTRERG
jgi:hypothetical protein